MEDTTASDKQWPRGVTRQQADGKIANITIVLQEVKVAETQNNKDNDKIALQN